MRALTPNAMLPHLSPGPGRAWVDGDVLDIGRRIQQGDESGWRGDPTMWLAYNAMTGRFEVWATDLGGNQYIAASHDECNHVLIQKLIAGDPRRGDVLAGVLEVNARARADAERREREQRLIAHDKLAWALRKDLGHLYGGTRRQHSMHGAYRHKEPA